MKYIETMYEIKKSKHYGYIKEIYSVDEAKLFIEYISKKNKKANHNCFAYIVNGQKKAYDDGEPKGTAGKPIHSSMNMRKMNSHVIVVSRYFGGIKLGGGGLIRAYRKTALQTIDKLKEDIE